MKIFKWRTSSTPRDKSTVESNLVDENSPIVQAAYRQMGSNRRNIEVVVDDPTVERRLMERIVAQWQALGATEPFWCNCTTDVYRSEHLDDDVKTKFYKRGDGTLALIEAFESRSGVKINNGVCLDFGCGVGRIIEPLSSRFREVIGVDVSASLLEHCNARARQIGAANVKTVLLTDVDVLTTLGPLDLFLSISVLQHNPPPVQRAILKAALATIRPGGFCLFQTPDWLDDYTFNSHEFLSDAPEKSFDLHCLPKPDVLQILRESNMTVLDFAPDFELAQFGSYFYFAQKSA